MIQPNDQEHSPLGNIDEWEDFVNERLYPEAGKKQKSDYRNYDEPGRDTVRDFCRLNHQFQTYDFVLGKKENFLRFDRKEMTVFEALDFLNTLVDDSDPDIELDQLQHLLQTSESIRADGHEDWFVVTALLHDLGKVLCLFGEPQWAVVGDTFPVGCKFSDRIVYPEFFANNPDNDDPRYNTRLGVYSQGCGLSNVHLSWGHDEYMYHLMENYLPDSALYMIRYHSFYAWHREGDYDYLCDDKDRENLHWVKKFNPYDLYSKCPVLPDWEKLRPYYADLIAKYLPETIKF
jgi:inositol oxygenase